MSLRASWRRYAYMERLLVSLWRVRSCEWRCNLTCWNKAQMTSRRLDGVVSSVSVVSNFLCILAVWKLAWTGCGRLVWDIAVPHFVSVFVFVVGSRFYVCPLLSGAIWEAGWSCLRREQSQLMTGNWCCV